MEILKRFFNREDIILYKITPSLSVSQTSKANIQAVSSTNVNDITKFQDQKYIKVFSSFLKRGDKGFYAYLNRVCVHRSWLQVGPTKVELPLGYKYLIKKDEGFIHYCETAASARGMNIYPAVLYHIIQCSNLKTFYISITASNFASAKGILKVGFVPYKKLKIIKIGKIKIAINNDK